MADPERPTQAQRDFAERLFRDHGARLRAIARRNSLNAQDAEEAFQRTMVIAMRADPEMTGSPVAWATTVLKREAWNVQRKRTHRIHQPVPDQRGRDPLDRLPAPDTGPQESAERAERVRAFRRAFDSLKPQERQVLLLLGAGLKYKEIERETGFTQTKINRCIAEGRADLRERMARWEREGPAALEGAHNVRSLTGEPTTVLLRRRRALVDARRADANRASAASREHEAFDRRRERLQRAKARRLSLEASADASPEGVREARTAEQDARRDLKRLGGRRGALGLRETNARKREEALTAIDEELGRRREPVLLDAVRRQPRYVQDAFGPRPQQPGRCARWCAGVDRLVALRQLHGITDPDRALGADPGAEARKALVRIRRSLTIEPAARQLPNRSSGPELAA